MCDRGVEVDHSTLSRWVQKYAPVLEQRDLCPHLKPTNDSWRVDETYIKVRGEDRYLYRAIDSDGNKSGLFTNSQTGCLGSETVLP